MAASSRWVLVFLSVTAALDMAAGPAHASEPRVPIDASARSVSAHLHRDGAAQVLAELDRRPALTEAVLAGVETADPAWLRVARDLRGQADGADAEALDMAVARALPNHPSRVLALVGHGVELERICTSPFIEPAPGVAEHYASRTLAALATVCSPELRPSAAACARRVQLPTT